MKKFSHEDQKIKILCFLSQRVAGFEVFYQWTEVFIMATCVHCPFPVWEGWGRLPIPPIRSSQAPAGSPRSQLSSDTIYLEMHQIPQAEGSVPRGCSAASPGKTSAASHKPRLCPGLLTKGL